MRVRRGIVVAKGCDYLTVDKHRERRHPIFSEEPYEYAVVLNEPGSVSAPKKTIHIFNGNSQKKVVYAEKARIYGDSGVAFFESMWNQKPAQVHWFVPELEEHKDDTLKSLRRIWFDSRPYAPMYPYIPYHKRFEQIFDEWSLQQWDVWLRWFLWWMGNRNPIPKMAKTTCMAAYPPAIIAGETHLQPKRLQAVYTVIPYLPEAWIFKNHPPYIKACKFCKHPIINIDSRREYCDEACKNKAYRDRKKRNGKIIRHASCIHCGEILQDKRGGAKFCGDRCRQAYRRTHRGED